MKSNTQYRVAMNGVDYNVMVKATAQGVKVKINDMTCRPSKDDILKYGIIQAVEMLNHRSNLPITVLKALQVELKDTVAYTLPKKKVVKKRFVPNNSKVYHGCWKYVEGSDEVVVTCTPAMPYADRFTVYFNGESIYTVSINWDKEHLLTEYFKVFALAWYRREATAEKAIKALRILTNNGYKTTQMRNK